MNDTTFLVHCSAGIGRSGTLILVDTCLKIAETNKDLNLKVVFDTLMEMRTFRRGLIQTEQQLRFSVEAIVQGLKSLELTQDICSKQNNHTNGKRLKDADTDSEDTEDQEDCQSKSKKRKNSES